MYQRAVDVSPEMALAVIHALKKDGFSTVVAPYEADAQMAYLVRHGFVDGVVTEDSDLVPHRCASVFFKMDNDGMGQEIRYADVTANRDLSFAGFTPDQFLEMCVMSGCDYLPSLPGVGIKKAHALMRRFKRMTSVAVAAVRGHARPEKYEQGFKDALSVFKHQWVFCPVRGEMAHLSSAPPAREADARADGVTTNEAPAALGEDAERLIGPRRPARTRRAASRRASSTPMTLDGVRAAAHRGRACADPARAWRLLSPARRGGPRSAPTPPSPAPRGGARAETLATRCPRREPGRGLTPRSAGTEPRTKPRSPRRARSLRARRERWVTPPALTAANPGKRRLRVVAPSLPRGRRTLESRFDVARQSEGRGGYESGRADSSRGSRVRGESDARSRRRRGRGRGGSGRRAAQKHAGTRRRREPDAARRPRPAAERAFRARRGASRRGVARRTEGGIARGSGVRRRRPASAASATGDKENETAAAARLWKAKVRALRVRRE